MKNFVLAVLIVLIVSGFTQAQSISPATVNVSGGNLIKGYYHIDWSIGELALVNQVQFANGSNIITHGLLQPFTNRVQPNYSNTFSGEEIRILPNPTKDILEVDYLSLLRGHVVLQLYDAVGRVLYTKELTSNGNGFIEKIDMTALASGNYMLHIVASVDDTNGVQKTGSYKILKIN